MLLMNKALKIGHAFCCCTAEKFLSSIAPERFLVSAPPPYLLGSTAGGPEGTRNNVVEDAQTELEGPNHTSHSSLICGRSADVAWRAMRAMFPSPSTPESTL